MESKVNFHQSQEVPASELNFLQQSVQDSLDHIVRELLFDEGRFIDLPCVKTGPFEVTVGPGFFVNNGAVYRKSVTTEHNLTSLLPSSGFRKVLIVVAGQTADAATENRKFLVNATTRAAQPRSVATRKQRDAVIDVIAGPASSAPSRPAVGAGWKVIAELTLGNAGITVDPVAESANRALNLEGAMNAIASLQAQDKKTASLINTIRSEITGLAKEVATKADNRRVSAAVSDIVELREKLGVSDASSFFGLDDFANDDESDEAFPGYTARVEGGAIQMGHVETPATKLIALLNPNDTKVDKSESGLILPASSLELRLECDEYESDVAIASYAVSTVVGKKLTRTRVYLFYATKAGRSIAEQQLKANGKIKVKNPTTGDYETISLAGKAWKIEQHGAANKAAWKLLITEPYWDLEATDLTTTGSRIAQTFLCAQAGWHKRIALYFSDVGATGDVHVKVCRLGTDGDPDLSKIVANATLPVASLKRRAWVNVDFDPFFLERGSRFAIVLTTAGAHVIGCALQNGLTNGTLVASTDGVTWQADLAKDMMFRLYACKFKATKVVVEIEDISLAGGIREIQTILTGFTPSGTDLVVQGRIGANWRNLTEDDETVLSGLPTLVPLRLVFVGTVDLMPGIDLTKSRVIASRPRLSSVHVSTIRSIGSGTVTSIVVREYSSDFVEAKHDWTVTILHGGSYTTVANATAVKDTLRSDGIRGRTWYFTVPAISTYRIKTVIGATSIDDTPSVEARRDEAA
ncbi:hypothetical protein [Shinella kummerowiae]|uniref:hypothetical protein n=1 Tax=Shinella kummerowiae TaxID=417745 RepID=UPI0021B4EF7C|nr:hypothetical protein [Shinella kummerowiae]MCT7668160.1 hypothetical protein [Shinella kummerowiae]